jgi:ABC-type polar amino acid transport system ATPase subunit
LSQKLVTLDNVSKYFATASGPLKVLDRLSFSVHQGEVVSLIGPSGSGKSTCLRTINALETIEEGRIEVCGIDYTSSTLPVHKIRQKTAMIFQRFELFPHMTAQENVALGLTKVRGFAKQDAFDRAGQLLEEVGLGGHIHAYPQSLSGGQQQRVGIARALAIEPAVLLCDEPTSALDPELVDEVTEILQKVADSGMTMIVVTHEMSFAKNVSDRCLFLENGRILAEGPSKEFFENPGDPRLRRFLKKLHASEKL